MNLKIEQMEKLMICATKPYEITWNEKVYCDTVKESELKEMINLYYSVYSKSHVQSVARQKYEYYDALLKEQINDIDCDYSSIIHDSKTHEIIAVCLVQEWEQLPYILDIVVNPMYQNQGIGEMMIKKVLHRAKDKYPAIRLSVNPGNPAEYLYHKLGFIGGTITYKLKYEN
ncbi:GNAT family N-acetyltransferase [Mycoplasmatota bacterium]|nr:GNAT family N-acetyltransferase [Mycoplasmatota bacterium]